MRKSVLGEKGVSWVIEDGNTNSISAIVNNWSTLVALAVGKSNSRHVFIDYAIVISFAI